MILMFARSGYCFSSARARTRAVMYSGQGIGGAVVELLEVELVLDADGVELDAVGVLEAAKIGRKPARKLCKGAGGTGPVVERRRAVSETSSCPPAKLPPQMKGQGVPWVGKPVLEGP